MRPRAAAVVLALALALLLAACGEDEGGGGLLIEPWTGTAEPTAEPSASLSPAPTTEPISAAPDPPAPATLTLGFVGDLMLARRVEGLMHDEGPLYPFEHVLPLFEGIDLLVGNLEGTFTNTGTPLNKRYAFRTSPALASALRDAGFFAVSLANNHATDFGLEGLARTVDALEEAGVRWFGAGLDEKKARAPLFAAQLNRPRVAFLGYSSVAETIFATGDRGGVAHAIVEAIEQDVRRAAKHADIIVVSLHSGVEYSHHLTEEQRTLARAAIDAGAALVVGHHPHVLQPWERYGDGVILYSLGNFVFDLDAEDLEILGPGAFQTAVAVVTFQVGAPVEVAFRLAVIDPYENRPRLPTEQEIADIEAILVPLHEHE